MSALDALLLISGGLAAGVINAMAGGGSLITVPLLVLVGLDGDIANGSNRIGVLGANASSAGGFTKAGVDGFAHGKRILLPVVIGAAVGAAAISQVDSDAFERLFGFVMIPLLLLTLFRRKPALVDATDEAEGPSPMSLGRWAIYVGVGLYGGAFQAGVGLLLVAALAREGMDLVTANAVKVLVTFGFTAIAIPIFIATGKIDWPAALVLAVGFIAGGAIGARVAIRGGEKLIRPVLAVAVVALAGRMLGLY